YKLVFFMSEDYKESVNEELFAVDAGKYKNYDSCSFEILRYEQFRPLKGSQSHFGNQGTLEGVCKYRVEMM
ncbi:MAG: hypothetical protein BYD32DRAFT_354138, partial [Podila humilis]